MGVAWLIYDRVLRQCCVSRIEMWNIGESKWSDDILIKNLTEKLLNSNIANWAHVCFLEKQGGIAQRKVIRVEQHIATLLRYSLHIGVLTYSPILRNKDKPKGVKTSAWLTSRCGDVLSRIAHQSIINQFNQLKAKPKTDIGAAVLQTVTFLDKESLIEPNVLYSSPK